MIRFKVVDTPAVRLAVTGASAQMRVGDAVVVRASQHPYGGPYVVTPKVDEQQTLPTRGKSMSEDVLVLAVPYYETDNQNGTTIFIASEV